MSNSLALAIDDGGRGTALPVVFLHSAGGNASHFEPQLKHFRRTRRTLAFDLRGHGRSPGGRCDDLAQHAADVLGGLDELGLERAVLCGHSWGAAVALEAAWREPNRFAGVFFIDPASDGRAIPQPEAEGLLATLTTDYEATVTTYWRSLLAGARPDDARRILEALLSCAPDVVIGTLACTLRWDPVSRLEALTMPRHALITPFNDVPSAWHRLVPSLPHSRIEHTSHWPHVDAPGVVNERLERFFETLR